MARLIEEAQATLGRERREKTQGRPCKSAKTGGDSPPVLESRQLAAKSVGWSEFTYRKAKEVVDLAKGIVSGMKDATVPTHRLG